MFVYILELKAIFELRVLNTKKIVLRTLEAVFFLVYLYCAFNHKL